MLDVTFGEKLYFRRMSDCVPEQRISIRYFQGRAIRECCNYRL